MRPKFESKDNQVLLHSSFIKSISQGCKKHNERALSTHHRTLTCPLPSFLPAPNLLQWRPRSTGCLKRSPQHGPETQS